MIYKQEKAMNYSGKVENDNLDLLIPGFQA